jgi:hypothetical protein
MNLNPAERANRGRRLDIRRNAVVRSLRNVYLVDGVRTPFGKAGPQALFWHTRADDMAVRLARRRDDPARGRRYRTAAAPEFRTR